MWDTEPHSSVSSMTFNFYLLTRNMKSLCRSQIASVLEIWWKSKNLTATYHVNNVWNTSVDAQAGHVGWRHKDKTTLNSMHCTHMQCEPKKNPSWVLLTFSPKSWGIFSPNFTCLLHVSICARIHIFIQLPATLTKLCHIKFDHPACVSANSGHIEHMMWTRWLHLIWHNFVTVAVNGIKICNLV